MKGSALRHELMPSPNHEPRRLGVAPTILLLHYTGMESAAVSLQRLCDPGAKVSCHYLVDEQGKIVQMVDEDERAWHAGRASWRGMTDINSASIGIEIQNIGHNGDYPPFTDIQMDAVVALCADIVRRNKIRPEMVLAHSDVSPDRKDDPGEKFDWRRLHEAGVGAWVEPAAETVGASCKPGDSSPEVRNLQAALNGYGYDIAPTGLYDHATELVVVAFQRHFRPSRVDGVADPSTIATLQHLMREFPLNPSGTA